MITNRTSRDYAEALKRDGASLSLYQVARKLQLLLAVWTGACPTCHRNMPEPIPT